MLEVKDIPYKVGGVYIIRCLKNNKAYVGQSKNIRRRISEHRIDLRGGKHRNSFLQEDFNIYGESNFTAEVVAANHLDMDALEVSLISRARKDNLCYNIFGGGRENFTVTQEFRDKISKAHKGRIRSEETKRKCAESARRQWENPEYRNRMIDSAKKQWKNEAYRKIMQETHVGSSVACGHKLTAEDVIQMRIRKEEGSSISSLAKEYGVTYATARAAILRHTWKNI